MKMYLGNNTHGYQPEETDRPKCQHPPTGGSGIVNLTDSLVEDKLIDRIEALEQRVLALENKRPEYVPPPVYGPTKAYGPTKEYCNRCGNYVDRNHVCFASVK